LQDEVNFLSISPWPVCANGHGPSLELLSPELDNTLSLSWRCLSDYGSPGEMNVATAVEDHTRDEISVYPNPVRNKLYIKGMTGEGEVQLFDLNGRLILSETTGERLNLERVRTGIYILKLVANNKLYVFKIVKY
jgi:hypothetical protein